MTRTNPPLPICAFLLTLAHPHLDYDMLASLHFGVPICKEGIVFRTQHYSEVPDKNRK